MNGVGVMAKKDVWGNVVSTNAAVGRLGDLDEFDRPRRKLPDCPKCDEDELGVIHADLILCYRCGWKVEGEVNNGRV
jgi:ribosomal protein L37AE/L43A